MLQKDHIADKDHAVILLIIAGTIILLILGIFIISFLFLYQRKHNMHLSEKQVLQAHFQQILLQSQLEIQEQTMQTIGIELHDNVGQLLSLISLTLNSIELENIDKAQQKIGAAIELNLKSIKEMRQLGRLLQGEQLVTQGLEEAIRSEISWIEKTSRFNVNYGVEGGKPAANNPDKDLILFRITQEIFNNAIKHSQAKDINVKLVYSEGDICLTTIDNGAGFDVSGLSEPQKGMGLKNIQKRAEIVGGQVCIQSQPGEGTCIEICIPYP
ncbi:MAG TPA: sensor histidine kinase [Mucilaginibacter sp.]|jgi:signal transduction histidine kinase|nr:sensor histidine kinase [Mucilaginibacter sp.]